MKQKVYLTEQELHDIIMHVINESEDEGVVGALGKAGKMAVKGAGKLMSKFGNKGAQAGVQKGVQAGVNGGLRNRMMNSKMGQRFMNSNFANKNGLNFAKQDALKSQQAGLTKNIGREQASIDKISGELANKNGRYYTKNGKLNGGGHGAQRYMQGAQSRNVQNNIDLGSVNNELTAMKNARAGLRNKALLGGAVGYGLMGNSGNQVYVDNSGNSDNQKMASNPMGYYEGDFSSNFGGYGGYDNYGGYGDYGYDNYGGYGDYGYDNYGGYGDYGYDNYGGYGDYGYGYGYGYGNYLAESVKKTIRKYTK